MSLTFETRRPTIKDGRAAFLDEPPAEAATHPEEMKAVVEVQWGRSFAMKASARLTPAGLVCGAIAAAAVLLSSAALVRAVRADKVR
ncbi:hypothetical protein Msil_0878 [Methylocella silvestris BL2]|uniref:Uncharacterized protein n=1 Tax=Methylocella silvestris (strain DSM 15510 / CIP 108128 / LMG 27833 / NCIMB 13906 / BL2) TaxID=395965 RepID=B8ESF8_METSB|nr:hypothetical protein [Methylocella silvestris]ACK49848.1 hypothetical protein Msil_0878 [Methylocella silvestris BL2]